mgnify:FL=1
MTERLWSMYQRAIFADVAEGSGHVLVRARAGSGKSSAIEECVRRVPPKRSVLVTAFGKDIATAMSKRLPPSAWVRTLHSFGFYALRNAFGTKHDDDKVDRIIAELLGPVHRGLALNLGKLVSRAKATLARNRYELNALIDVLGIDLVADERYGFVEMAADILAACHADTKTCDRDDMIWLPVRHRIRVPTFDFVFVDEQQDFNRAQNELVLMAVKRRGRCFAFADNRQAIFHFRGADAHAVEHFIERMNARVLPLSITYRCCKAIVRLAQNVVPDFEAAPDAPEGIDAIVTVDDLRANAQPGDFVISRKNAPLIGLCLWFLSQGKPASIAGRNIGAGLLALIDKSKARSVEGLLAWVETWREREADRLFAAGQDPQDANDSADCIVALCADSHTVAEVRARIAALFSDLDDAKRIVCASTHKAKGLERDRAWILATTYSNKSTEEINLWYVAITRARTELFRVGRWSGEVVA